MADVGALLNHRSIQSTHRYAHLTNTRLRELGWIENRTVAIDYRWGEGREERFAEVADEFVRLKVDVIVTSGTPAVLASICRDREGPRLSR